MLTFQYCYMYIYKMYPGGQFYLWGNNQKSTQCTSRKPPTSCIKCSQTCFTCMWPSNSNGTVN